MKKAYDYDITLLGNNFTSVAMEITTQDSTIHSVRFYYRNQKEETWHQTGTLEEAIRAAIRMSGLNGPMFYPTTCAVLKALVPVASEMAGVLDMCHIILAQGISDIDSIPGVKLSQEDEA